jgi:uncharacterized protein YkwD
VNKPTRRAVVTTGGVAVAAVALAVGVALVASASTPSAATARLASNPLASSSSRAPSPRLAGQPTILPPTVPGSVSPSSTSPSSSAPVVIPPAPAPAPARQNAATVVPVANANNGSSNKANTTNKKVTAAAGCSAGAVGGWAVSGDIATTLFNQINAERKANCLPALGRSGQLNSSAHGHNLAMASTGVFDHQVPGEASLGDRISATGYHWSSAGENIAWGSNTSVSFAESLETEMYNEPPNQQNHRANILSKSFHNVGVDVYTGSDGKMWITCDFGS